jgi:hypothetical protein
MVRPIEGYSINLGLARRKVGNVRILVQERRLRGGEVIVETGDTQRRAILEDGLGSS